MKKALIIAAVLLALGITIGLGGLAMMGFDFSKLSSVTYMTQTYTPEGHFSDITIIGITCDVRIAKSEDGICKVVCHVDDRLEPTVAVKDDKLMIHVDDNLKWYQRIGFGWGTNEVTVYLPEDTYNALVIETTTGDVCIESGFIFTDVTVQMTTGDIQVTSLTCESFWAKVTTGDMVLRDVLTERMTLKGTTGDIELTRCDGEQIDIHNTTGDVEGTLLTGKQFTADATTGTVRVPSDSGSGTCNIKTTTGDIHITVA